MEIGPILCLPVCPFGYSFIHVTLRIVGKTFLHFNHVCFGVTDVLAFNSGPPVFWNKDVGYYQVLNDETDQYVREALETPGCKAFLTGSCRSPKNWPSRAVYGF